MPAPFRTSRTAVVAVVVSLVVHAALLAAFALLRHDEAPSRLVVDTRVGEAHVLQLVQIEPSAKPSAPVYPVSVALTPDPVAGAPAEAGPVVDSGHVPGAVRGHGKAPAEGNGGKGSSFYGVPVQARSVVYVVDRSLSMWRGPLDRARRELTASLAALSTGAEFQVILYNQSARPLEVNGSDQLLPASAADDAMRLIADVCPEGGSDHIAAVRLGLALRPDLLFVVSDGDGLTPAGVRQLTAFNTQRTVIHAIDVGHHPAGGEALRLLAEANRGRSFRPGAGHEARRTAQ